MVSYREIPFEACRMCEAFHKCVGTKAEVNSSKCEKLRGGS